MPYHSCTRAALQLILVHAINANQLGLEDQSGTAGDRTNATVAVAVLRGNGESALLANAHVQKTLVPAIHSISQVQQKAKDRNRSSPLDDTSSSELEAQGNIALEAGVELLAGVLQGAAVVHLHTITVLGLASALDLVSDLNAELGGTGEGGEREEDGGETHCGWVSVKRRSNVDSNCGVKLVTHFSCSCGWVSVKYRFHNSIPKYNNTHINYS